MSLVGRQIGRYRILEQLGQGGMSVVYKGLDTTLDREVAVKVLHPHLSGRPESRKRLEREAKAVARLRHPNILEIFDFSGESSADSYLVTEYIRGVTLRQFITDEALQPPEVAAMVIHELASALAHAHEAGILHRDLKPENVMVRDDGVLKLMDFGIAKILDRDEKMTMTGALVGSPAHMAPEIIEGEEAGAEADVFSLGTMLYLFATGRLPFVAPNTTATLKKILDSVYDDPRQVMPTVSDELTEIIDQCLRRQPSERFSNATKLRDALAEMLAGVGVTRPHEELARFFLDPKAYRKELTPRITSALLARAEQLIADKKSAKAMSALNQVLAHDPSNARASELLGQMQARKQREVRIRKMRRAVVLSISAVVLSGAGIAGVRFATRPLPFTYQFPLGPTDVVLTNVTWPRPPDLTPPAPAPEPTAPEPIKTVAAVHPTPKPTNEPLDIVAIVRPFGYLQVDDGARSTDALARHVIKLTPGKHRFKVTCDFCETAGRTTVVEVHSGEVIPLIAPLLPSLVSFSGWPDEARVRVGSTEMTVKESQSAPFHLTTPASGNQEMRHKVEYSVSVDGAASETGISFASPGKPLVIERGAR